MSNTVESSDTGSDTAVEWVGPAEYARRKGLSLRTVRAYLKQGLIPGAEQAAPRHAHRIPMAI